MTAEREPFAWGPPRRSAAAWGPFNGFGLYLHWPYCARICPYCDFNVYRARDRDPAPLAQAMRTQIAAEAARLPDHPALDTVYFGGGTPSLMRTGDIAALLEEAARRFGLSQGAEITLEANPADVSPARLADWRALGVTRLSLGVQSLDDAALRFLGRDHDAATAREAARLALSAFSNVSVDLIYARPGQSPAAWRAELEAVLSLGAPHLALYELTIAERTAFGQAAARGRLVPMPEDDQADLYELTADVTSARGLPAYEVSNHAASREAVSRHNSLYWSGADWLGIGPGAHGRLTLGGRRFITETARGVADYVAAPLPALEKLSPPDAAAEAVAMGLRPAWGLDEAVHRDWLDWSEIDLAEARGLARQAEGRIALTEAGWLLADALSARFLDASPAEAN